MKLYHWNAEGAHLMVVAESEDAARLTMVQCINGWRGQNPARFDAILNAVQKRPHYVAVPGHVITIDTKEV